MNPLQTSKPGVVDAFAKAGHDGWVTREQRQASVRKSVLRTATTWIAPPGSVTSRTLLLLPDAAQVKRCVDGYFQALADAPATFAGPQRPSASVITQAHAIYQLIQQGASPRVGPVTGVLTQGLTGVPPIPGVAGMGSDEERAAFKRTMGWLYGLDLARVPYGVLVDLAHLIVLAQVGNCQPKIVTGDRDILEAFANVCDVPLFDRASTEPFGAYVQRTGVALPLWVTVPDGPTFGVIPIDIPADPTLAPAPMASLVGSCASG
jgi:hypothetical protein